jgi:hypothetical protein
MLRLEAKPPSNSTKKDGFGSARELAGKVGDEEHKLSGGEIAVRRGTNTDLSGERRHTPSEKVAHQLECHLGLEALGRI